uniref:Uncharacterized protein n=1 Tax=Anopheles minimus TaxID=112268 RepID=A0A182WNI2_9DIPT
MLFSCTLDYPCLHDPFDSRHGQLVNSKK